MVKAIFLRKEPQLKMNMDRLDIATLVLAMPGGAVMIFCNNSPTLVVELLNDASAVLSVLFIQRYGGM